MTERAEIAVDRLGDAAVVRVQGDLTAADADTLEAQYATAADSGANRILISFREGDHINSAGIGVLIGLVMNCRQRNLAMVLVHPAAHFRKIFDLVGLSRYVAVFESVPQALATEGLV